MSWGGTDTMGSLGPLNEVNRIQTNGKTVMADDPIMAIANGLYKLGFGLK